jgi:hypothetical protein
MIKDDRKIVEKVIQTMVISDSSLRPLEIIPDSDYETIYGFDITPCCLPLPCTAWLNPKTPGLFLRCLFPAVSDSEHWTKTISLAINLNTNLPTGCFSLGTDERRLVFKNGFYIGEEVSLSEKTAIAFFESSKEFICGHWKLIFEAALGSSCPHQNQ